MGVLIEGMEMPTKENVVILITPSGDVWMIGDMPNEDTHLVKAKAVPVPEPHGRLIDADALEQDVQKRLLVCNKNDNQFQKPYEVIRAIALAPTIIPASKEVE